MPRPPPIPTLFPTPPLSRSEIAEQRARRDRHVLHAAFDEVAGGRRLGEHDQRRRHLERHRLRQHPGDAVDVLDRKSTRLNSSHLVISYAVFCLKKKKLYYHD